MSLAITLGKYKDENLCNMVLMEATHMLLQRPWKYDRKMTYDGVTNKFSFVTLIPLSPKEVCEDQLKMKQKRDEEKRKEKEKERKLRKESKEKK
ncbi:hypothetical protein CR513_46515, partial [Mucuna pruriens]